MNSRIAAASAVLAAMLLLVTSAIVIFDDSEADSGYRFEGSIGPFDWYIGQNVEDIDVIDVIRDTTGLGLTSISSYDISGLPGWIQLVIDEHGSSTKAPRAYLEVNPIAECSDADFWFSINGIVRISINDVSVQDLGGDVTPEDVHTFTVYFDTRGGNSVDPWIHSDRVDSYVFDLSDIVPVRDGFEFKGWSLDVSGGALLQDSSVTVSLSDDGRTGSVLVYAIWDDTPGISLPDPLREILELISDPVVLVMLFVITFAVAYLVRIRKMGEW